MLKNVLMYENKERYMYLRSRVSNENQRPSFGINWSKSTVKFLKKNAPALVEENGYETAKQGVLNLINLSKKNDGITAKITDEGLSEFFIAVKNKSLKNYIYGPMQSSIDFLDVRKTTSYAETFKSFTEYISTPEFVTTSSKAINDASIKRKNLTFARKIESGWHSVKEKCSDIADSVVDAFSLVLVKTDKKSYVTINFIDTLTDKLHPVKTTVAEKQQAKELRTLIDILGSKK